MYYQSYEDYMRDVLGYPRECQGCTYNYGMTQNRRTENQDIERLYPEIYRTVYPMVCKACNQYNGEITEELVERLTNEVYANLETEQDVRSEQPKTTAKTSVNKTDVRREEETRQRRPNNTLRDLIRILIIRELLGLPNRPGRPPFPGGGPRPPFPGGPGPRLPMRTKTAIPKNISTNGLYGRNAKLYTLW